MTTLQNPRAARRSVLSRASLAMAINAAVSVVTLVLADDVCDTIDAGESGSGSTAAGGFSFASDS